MSSHIIVEKGFLPIWALLLIAIGIASAAIVAFPRPALTPTISSSATMPEPSPSTSFDSAQDKLLGTAGDYTNWKTYRNEQYGFEVKYPGDGYVVEEGADAYEKRFLQEGIWSGTQQPLLEQIRFGYRDGDFAVFIDIPDHKNFPVVRGEYDWWLRPCGQEGFAEIKSRAKVDFKGYPALYVASIWDEGNREFNYYCINSPKNPLIIFFLSEFNTQADQILSTFRFLP